MSEIAVITGGTSGIGKATALCLRDAGYDVYELSRREQGVEGLHHIRCDITDEDQVRAAVAEIIGQAGRIDVLINNAGFGISGAVEFTDTAEAQRLLDVNFFGMVRMNKAVIPHMRQAGRGRIVNLSSVAAPCPIPFQAYYSAGKAAVNAYTKALANEWAKYGINVNAIAPGYMATNNTNQLRQDEDRSEEILARIPAGRWGTPADVGGAAIFLASDTAAYVNGYTLAVDGGWLAR